MNAKRPYRLGRRQASVDETRRRILESALAEYAESGIDRTSMQAVARRADVAPGTVLYHYPDPEDLAEAAIGSLYERYQAPSAELIPVDAPLHERVGVLVRELYSLYARSEKGYLILQKSPDHPVLQRAVARWEGEVGAMLARALGPGDHLDSAIPVVATLVDPGFRGRLIANGVDSEEAVAVATGLILNWLE